MNDRDQLITVYYELHSVTFGNYILGHIINYIYIFNIKYVYTYAVRLIDIASTLWKKKGKTQCTAAANRIMTGLDCLTIAPVFIVVVM